MKKKIALCLVFILCILSAVAEREKAGSFTKYEDRKNGYSGWASAQYWGTIKEKDAYKEMREMISNLTRYFGAVCLPLSKLTNEESFLMMSALAEYNYKKGEVYFVEIRDVSNVSAAKKLIFFITITGNDSLTWYGSRTFY